MHRGYNFGAGPAQLPIELLLEVRDELLNWNSLNRSILETGHRTKDFQLVLEEAESLLRRLLNIPENYHILFMGGSARLQMGMIPMNFLARDQQAGYLLTGTWSEEAFKEAQKVAAAYSIGRLDTEWIYQNNTAYVYFTPNETIDGVRITRLPVYNNLPLIADMTSCLLTEPLDINQYSMVFAGAQKNIANAGMALVIIKDEWLKTIQNNRLASMLDYRVQVEHHSLYATPPMFNCYLALKMLRWIDTKGGVESLYAINQKKAEALYQYIDSSSAYSCKVHPEHRSLTNVCFSLNIPALEDEFFNKAELAGLYSLQGHRKVGGARASLYNAMPFEGVMALIEFMADFAKEHKL